MGSVDREIPRGNAFGKIAKVAFDTAVATEPFFSHSGEISTLQQVVRLGAEKAIGPFFNTEVRHAERLEIADRFLMGDVGVVIDPTHILKRDTLEIYRLVIMSREMRKRPVGILYAEHIKEWWFESAHASAHSELIPIQTADTLKEYRRIGRKFDRAEVLHKFEVAMKKAVDLVVEQYGVLIVFGQGARFGHLYDAKNPSAIYRLYTEANERAQADGKDGPDFAILPVGMDLATEEDYDDETYEILKSHVNRNLPYIIDVGYADHVRNYLKRADGNPAFLDSVVMSDQQDLVTSRYGRRRQ